MFGAPGPASRRRSGTASRHWTRPSWPTRSRGGDALGEAGHQVDDLLLAQLVEDLVAHALQDAQLAVRPRQALDDRPGQGDRHQRVLGAMNVEQRQVPEARALDDRLV